MAEREDLPPCLLRPTRPTRPPPSRELLLLEVRATWELRAQEEKKRAQQRSAKA